MTKSEGGGAVEPEPEPEPEVPLEGGGAITLEVVVPPEPVVVEPPAALGFVADGVPEAPEVLAEPAGLAMSEIKR
jgi:hypothetical protein